MPSEAILDDEYVSLWYDPQGKIVHHKMKQFLIPGVFRRLLAADAELMERHGAKKLLSDDQANPVIAPDDINWADEEWFPRVRKAGFEYWAIVVSKTAPAVVTMQLKKLQGQRRGQGVTVELFETVEAARAWLESV